MVAGAIRVPCSPIYIGDSPRLIRKLHNHVQRRGKHNAIADTQERKDRIEAGRLTRQHGEHHCQAVTDQAELQRALVAAPVADHAPDRRGDHLGAKHPGCEEPGHAFR
jgi:hypothetical protein